MAVTSLATGSPSAAEDDRLIALWLHGRSPATVAGYGQDIRELRLFLGKPISACSLADLQAWSNELATRLHPSSVRRKLAAAKSLLKFGSQVGLLSVDVGSALRVPQPRDTLTERILSEPDVERLIQFEPEGRNRLILEVLYMAGIRVSELCRLQWRDLRRNRRAGQLTVYGKGAKTRTVWIPTDLMERLFAFRGKEKPTAAMFRSARGGHLTREWVWFLVKTSAEAVGLDGVGPHHLRHTHASVALHKGCPLDLLKQSMGHASITSTEVYLHAQPNTGSAAFLRTD